ncbi:DUF5947 family protein [Streptomyces sp. NPDC052396]|uniref:DUF5947 family protein n=1 Tax=Streptomyces sp. NPDC052396 TaxID=3365689 RepID=UPI0037D0803A
MTGGALARLVRHGARERRGASERCDLCDAPTEAGHRHLYATAREEVLCACQACALLFTQDGAGRDTCLLIPRRRLRLEPVPTRELGVPVGLAFFVPRTDGGVMAHYPSPAGATRWQVDPAAWQATVDRHPPLDTLTAEVEALLVDTAWGHRHHWIVPIDDCFRLVALVRREWTGLSGGSRVWPAVDHFFAELAEGPALGR